MMFITDTRPLDLLVARNNCPLICGSIWLCERRTTHGGVKQFVLAVWAVLGKFFQSLPRGRAGQGRAARGAGRGAGKPASNQTKIQLKKKKSL
jgi:hypothetical protein